MSKKKVWDRLDMLMHLEEKAAIRNVKETNEKKKIKRKAEIYDLGIL